MANNRVTTKDVYELIERLEQKIDKTYVTKTEFKPVRAIVYGFTALILTSVLGAVLAQIIIARGF